MSLEDVERIMDETQDAIEYQRVRAHVFRCTCMLSKSELAVFIKALTGLSRRRLMSC